MSDKIQRTRMMAPSSQAKKRIPHNQLLEEDDDYPPKWQEPKDTNENSPNDDTDFGMMCCIS